MCKLYTFPSFFYYCIWDGGWIIYTVKGVDRTRMLAIYKLYTVSFFSFRIGLLYRFLKYRLYCSKFYYCYTYHYMYIHYWLSSKNKHSSSSSSLSTVVLIIVQTDFYFFFCFSYQIVIITTFFGQSLFWLFFVSPSHVGSLLLPSITKRFSLYLSWWSLT